MRRISGLILTVILFCGLLWYFLSHHESAPSDLALITDYQEHSSWYPIVNITSNAFHIWRIDPIITWFASFGPGVNTDPGMPGFILHIAILLVGLLLCSKAVSNRPFFFISPVFVLLALIYLYGKDSVVIGSITWFPLFIWLCSKATGQNSRPGLFFLLIFACACRIALSANQLSFLVICTGWLIVSKISRGPQTSTSKAYSKFLIFVTLVPALFVLFTAPTPKFPVYPSTARVVADDGLPGMIRPMIGAHAGIPIINRAALREQFAPAAAVLLIFNAICLLRLFRHSKLWSTSLIIASLVALDLIASEGISQISPLESVCRLLPGLFLIPLSPLFLAVGLISFLLTSLGIEKSQFQQSLPALLSLLAGVISNSPLVDISVPKEVLDTKFLSNHSSIVSPSLNVFRNSQLWDQAVFSSKLTTILEGKDANLKILTYPGVSDKMLQHLVDGNLNTRWASKTGTQHGNEWIKVELPSAKTIVGVEIPTGKFTTDFPRGIDVLVSATCSDNFSSYKLVYRAASWQGPIDLTESGYPYFGGQQDVRFRFYSPETAKCLLIKQTAVEAYFDWSVAEINLVTAQ